MSAYTARLGASLKKITPVNIILGKALPFSIYDKNGILLLRQGKVIITPDQIEHLVTRGDVTHSTPLKEAGADAQSHKPAPPSEDRQSSFERINELTLNLKHVIDTTLKRPEQIDVTMRIGKIALEIQEICKEDSDSAIAAPCFDLSNPCITVHQMMGAVLTELIAHSKGLKQEQRLALVCAALTRDLGQIPIQSELDNHVGPLPDTLRARIHQHPNLSAQLLASAGVTDPLWLDAVRGHHERLNGSGYPAALKDDQVFLGSRILAVADTYSAMIQPRPYRKKTHFSQNAIKEIYQKQDTEIDGEIVRILISRIGLLPPGAIVKLKCGEIAVIKSHTLKPEAAIVYTIFGKSGTLLSHPVRRDTSEPNYEITGLVPYSECRAAAVIIKRVWTNF